MNTTRRQFFTLASLYKLQLIIFLRVLSKCTRMSHFDEQLGQGYLGCTMMFIKVTGWTKMEAEVTNGVLQALELVDQELMIIL